ncbi:MAG TPA: hypothetical protein VFP64_08515, partial [Pyrinomonadaceae bacterium]|nr:hypothetical protein [Pyrinomonadaceae bacterium]
MKTIGSAAVASAFPNVLLGAQAERTSVAVFWEPGFPAIKDCGVTKEALQQSLSSFAVTFLNERELIEQLSVTRFDLLVTPYGSAFPKRAWNEILKYLRAGGNWLNVGGVPLSRPVMRAGVQWRAEPHQTTYHKLLGITHSFPVKGDASSSYEGPAELKNGLKATEIYELYIRLSSSNNEPDEAGSDGPHEGVVEAWLKGINSDGRRVAAPVIQIDRLRAEFAGGRWILANFTGTLDPDALRLLAEIASQGASRFEVETSFACYRQDETPSFSVGLMRPKGDLFKRTPGDYSIEVRNEAGALVHSFKLPFADNANATSLDFPDTPKLPP